MRKKSDKNLATIWLMNIIWLLWLCLYVPSIVAVDSDEPILIVISFDAFKPEYLDKGVSIFIDQFYQRGIISRHMNNVFPTKTFVNHFSIGTGKRNYHLRSFWWNKMNFMTFHLSGLLDISLNCIFSLDNINRKSFYALIWINFLILWNEHCPFPFSFFLFVVPYHLIHNSLSLQNLCQFSIKKWVSRHRLTNLEINFYSTKLQINSTNQYSGS